MNSLKKLLLISLCSCLLPMASFGDTGVVEVWSETYDGGNFDYAQSVTTDSSDNIIVTGYVDNGTDDDYHTIKYNSSGTEQWSKTYDSGDYDYARSVTTDSSDNIIVTGESYNGTDDDYHTIKYDSSGTEQWSETYDGGDVDHARSVTTDSSDNVIVTGDVDNGTDDDYHTIKYNSSGTEQWSKTYDGGDVDHAQSVTTDSSDNIIVTGYVDNGTDYDYHTIKYEENEPPNASYTHDAPKLTGNDVNFDASGSSDSDGTVENYEWDWDNDGSYESSGVSLTNPSHSWSDDGTYIVVLRVTDNDGGVDTYSDTVTIENRSPTADFTYTVSDLTVDVDGSSSSDQDGSISAYSWDWTSDGTYDSSGETSSKTYSSGGQHDITLQAEDDDGATATKTQTVNIYIDTQSFSDLSETSVTLEGESFTSGDVYFQYRQSGSSSWNATSKTTESSGVTFSESVSGLSSSTEYEYRAAIDADDGTTYYGSTELFTTPSVWDYTELTLTRVNDVDVEAAGEDSAPEGTSAGKLKLPVTVKAKFKTSANGYDCHEVKLQYTTGSTWTTVGAQYSDSNYARVSGAEQRMVGQYQITSDNVSPGDTVKVRIYVKDLVESVTSADISADTTVEGTNGWKDQNVTDFDTYSDDTRPELNWADSARITLP